MSESTLVEKSYLVLNMLLKHHVICWTQV